MIRKLLILVVAAGLTACGKSGDDNEQDNDQYDPARDYFSFANTDRGP